MDKGLRGNLIIMNTSRDRINRWFVWSSHSHHSYHNCHPYAGFCNSATQWDQKGEQLPKVLGTDAQCCSEFKLRPQFFPSNRFLGWFDYVISTWFQLGWHTGGTVGTWNSLEHAGCKWGKFLPSIMRWTNLMTVMGVLFHVSLRFC